MRGKHLIVLNAITALVKKNFLESIVRESMIMLNFPVLNVNLKQNGRATCIHISEQSTRGIDINAVNVNIVLSKEASSKHI